MGSRAPDHAILPVNTLSGMVQTERTGWWGGPGACGIGAFSQGPDANISR